MPGVFCAVNIVEWFEIDVHLMSIKMLCWPDSRMLQNFVHLVCHIR